MIFFSSSLLMNSLPSFIFAAAPAADMPQFLLFLIYSVLAPREFRFCFFSEEEEEKQWLQGLRGPWMWNGHRCFVQLLIWLGTAEKVTYLTWTVRTSANLRSLHNPLSCILHRPCLSVLVKPYLKSCGLSGSFKWLIDLWVFRKYNS